MNDELHCELVFPGLFVSCPSSAPQTRQTVHTMRTQASRELTTPTTFDQELCGRLRPGDARVIHGQRILFSRGSWETTAAKQLEDSRAHANPGIPAMAGDPLYCIN